MLTNSSYGVSGLSYSIMVAARARCTRGTNPWFGAVKGGFVGYRAWRGRVPTLRGLGNVNRNTRTPKTCTFFTPIVFVNRHYAKLRPKNVHLVFYEVYILCDVPSKTPVGNEEHRKECTRLVVTPSCKLLRKLMIAWGARRRCSLRDMSRASHLIMGQSKARRLTAFNVQAPFAQLSLGKRRQSTAEVRLR